MTLGQLPQRVTACLCIGVMAALAGCASHPGAAPKTQAATQPSTTANATILSMRKIAAPNSRDPWRNALLANVAAGNATTDPRPLVEFIVRADDGATLSIVQANPTDFHPGDRVVIRHDIDTHLTPPG